MNLLEDHSVKIKEISIKNLLESFDYQDGQKCNIPSVTIAS